MTVCFAVIYGCFFFLCKRGAVLPALCAYTADPYDAVGSFGIQLAAIVCFVAFVRAMRMRQSANDGEVLFFARSLAVVDLTVLATMVSDVIAMLRTVPSWGHAVLGWSIFADNLVMAAASAMLCALAARAGRAPAPGVHLLPWRTTLLVWVVVAGMLAVYPSTWESGMLGGVLTALVGMLALFALVATGARSLLGYAQSMDAGYGTTILGWPGRSVPWRRLAPVTFALLAAAGFATWTLVAEAVPSSRVVTVLGVYALLEFCGVLTGHVTLTRFLELI
ncbi:hypothetical protein [Candidatus Cryosericum terrychapinii]|uniref:Uncharacterized protein n=1 Tax=Candidatus Cryosericum terrychapinii TaxID=2290919 RepID=A0A398D305_9BACT|nr:hypothetical protein [Candidatus Cryosericum terrychapinii]RIE06627.1 hypothetical protein SMC7_01055 [Candidatus Cryosericum terrychapinii]